MSRDGTWEELVRLKKKYNICILAPSGKDKEPLPWKTGYYYIAKSLGWDLRVVGFDFESKRLKIGNIISSSYPIEKSQDFLQKEMEDIVPMRPENSWTPIRQHDKKKISFINLDLTMIFFFLVLITWIVIMKIYKISFFHIFLSAYGFLLQLHSNILIKIIGLLIIYQHIFVEYMCYPRVPKPVIILGALTGVLIGCQYKNSYIYIPLLYSFLSKVPVYVTDFTDQFRVILLTIIISIVLGEHTSVNIKNYKRDNKNNDNK